MPIGYACGGVANTTRLFGLRCAFSAPQFRTSDAGRLCLRRECEHCAPYGTSPEVTRKVVSCVNHYGALGGPPQRSQSAGLVFLFCSHSSKCSTALLVCGSVCTVPTGARVVMLSPAATLVVARLLYTV